MDNHFDIIIIGTGAVGKLMALALEQQTDFSIGLIGPLTAPNKRAEGKTASKTPLPPLDQRTTAFMPPSIRLLERLGVWDDCVKEAAPLKQLRMTDLTGGLFKAPDCLFSPGEIGLDAFAYNISNIHLNKVLETNITKSKQIHWVSKQFLASMNSSKAPFGLKTKTGETFTAHGLIGADGRNSFVRQKANIKLKQTPYPQTALVCNLAHEKPHGFISTELHKTHGPMTFVPMKGNHSALIWSLDHKQAQRWKDADKRSFINQLFEENHGFLGKITDIGPRATFPIFYSLAGSFHKDELCLIGEAAHALPPIGAQGMNIGLMDVAVLADLLSSIDDIKDPSLVQKALADYERIRLTDVKKRALVIHNLNKSLLSAFLPFKVARSGGLAALKAFPILRKTFMNEGLGEKQTKLPSLMQI